MKTQDKAGHWRCVHTVAGLGIVFLVLTAGCELGHPDDNRTVSNHDQKVQEANYPHGTQNTDDGKTTYSGIVRYASGKPAAAVEVRFYSGFYWGCGNNVMTRTDEQGRFRVQSGKILKDGLFWGPIRDTNGFIARVPEKGLVAIAECHHSVKTVTLTLEPGITLAGSVKNPEGKPVPNALVDLRFVCGGGLAPVEPEAVQVDEHGQFRVRALPRNRDYFVNGVYAKGYATAYLHLNPTNTLASQYELPQLIIEPVHQRLAGQVLNTNGSPAAGVELKWVEENMRGLENYPTQFNRTRTGEDGRFSFEGLPPGKKNLYLWHSTKIERTEAQAGETNAVIQLSKWMAADPEVHWDKQ